MAPATVVVASYDRPAQLRRCLEGLVALDHPDARVIVVDDGSAAPLDAVVAPFGDRVSLIRQANAGPAAARNRGIAAARTDFVALIDDDCRPDRAWLRRLQAVHRRDPHALVGGRVVNELRDDPFASASQAIVDFLYAWHADQDDRLRFFTTNNVGFSRATFDAVGGFDPSFRFASEDRDLGLRWRASGRPLCYAADAIVAHAHAMTFRAFWRQHRSYGEGAWRLRTKLGKEAGARLRLEPARFYLGLLAHPATRVERGPWPGALLRSMLVGVSHVAMLQGYLAARAAAFAPAAAAHLKRKSRT